ncbi:hypothetical protein BKA65DRAFT_472173 [Rhexocercosporidium sp. MPI-PUGE-AT-0058]|nr:hypothetical protein BKA65DRAFT_472173 [Rhexocercosporidium sp. MPI-PUGE-AT-0058]
MRFSISSISLISGLTLLSTASARIIGFEAPRTIAAGKPFTVSLLTENYIQSVYDVAAAFGIATGDFPYNLGILVGSDYIGPDLSNSLQKLNFTVSTNANTVHGVATLSASVFSLYGAAYSPLLVPFNVSVTVGDTTSTDTVNTTVYTH